jgi:GNAT superfamily N-acetyltransferase
VSGIQAYLRAVAADDRQCLSTGPFDVFLDHESDHPYSNYAIPRDGAEPSQEAVSEITMVMQRAARLPRAEFLPATAPAAERALREFGFAEELRTPLMTCTSPPELATPDDVMVQQLGPDAEREQIEGLMRALALAFNEPFDPSTSESAATRFTRRIAVIAYADEEIAGGGMCLEAIDNVVELVGIGVVGEFRERGIGAAVTAELARLAFASGVEVAFLTPGSIATARVYERAGFEATDEMLHLSYPA